MSCDSFLQDAAKNLGMEVEEIIPILDELMLQFHKAIATSDHANPFVGSKLLFDTSPQTFYHLLCFLDYFSEKYKWEAGDASEYLLRLGKRSEWAPFVHQARGWVKENK